MLGQQGGNKKALRAKVLGGSQKTLWKLYSLFSSFLRGASCPKSPRVAAIAATLFMLEVREEVKSEKLALQQMEEPGRQRQQARVNQYGVGTRPLGQYVFRVA
ncbi:MAG: hypothetical protein NVS9B4_15490 [Candidatus Acidiferrum sp.]